MTNKLIVDFNGIPTLGDDFTLSITKSGVETDYQFFFSDTESEKTDVIYIGSNEEDLYINTAVSLAIHTDLNIKTSVRTIVKDPYKFIDKFSLIYGSGFDDSKYPGSIKYDRKTKELILFEKTTDSTPTPTSEFVVGGYFFIQPEDGSLNRIILRVEDSPLVEKVLGVGAYYRYPIQEIYSDFNLKELDLYYLQYFEELVPETGFNLVIEPVPGVRSSLSGSFDLIIIYEPIFFENQLESLLRSSQFMFNPSTSVANYVKVRFTIKMLQNPAIGHRVIFIGTITDGGSTYFGVFGLDKTATTSTNNTNNFIRGANLAASLQNLYDSIVLTYGSIRSIQVTLNSAANEIYIDVTDAANLNTRTYSILVDYYNTNATFQPTVSTIPIGGFDTVKFGIKVWEGDRYDDEPTTNNYEKTKQKIVPSQIRTYIDFNQFCKDKMEFDVNTHIQTTPQVANIPNNVGRWVKVSAQNFNLGQPDAIVSNTYYATDGWLKDGELHNIPLILTTNLNRVISRTTQERVYFKTQYLSSFSYRINGRTPIPVMIGADIEKSNEYIKSMALPPIDPNTKTISMIFNYTYPDLSFNIISVDFTISDSCFYKPVDLIYKNKWGVLETLSFNKVSVRKLEREGSQYQRSIVDMNGSYDILRHSKKEYNVDGVERWTLNTSWVPQNLNSQFEDLMMSEEVYMKYIDEYTNSKFIKPVLVKTDSFDFKTKTVNKLINYTIEVELSHNKINNFL